MINSFSAMKCFQMCFHKKFPVFIAIVNIQLFSGAYIPLCSDKSFIFRRKFDRGISIFAFDCRHNFVLSAIVVFASAFVEKSLGIPLNDVVGPGSWRSTDYTVIFIDEYHFIFHEEGFGKTVFGWNDCSIILCDVLTLVNGFSGE